MSDESNNSSSEPREEVQDRDNLGDDQVRGGDAAGGTLRRVLLTIWRLPALESLQQGRDFPVWSDWAQENVQYAAGQVERCPETGQLHGQWYVEFKGPVRANSVGKIWTPTLSNAEYRGFRVLRTAQKAEEYCTKERTRAFGPFFFGTRRERAQGKRSDLIEAAEVIRSSIGGSALAIRRRLAEVCPHTVIKYSRGLEALRAWSIVERPADPPGVLVLYGPTSSGKSFWVRSRYTDVFDVPLSSVHGGQTWFDGYNGERCMLLEEFYDQIPLPVLLRLTDRYSMQLPVKGGFVPHASTRIIFTSNHHPSRWWGGSAPKEQLAAFNARVVVRKLSAVNLPDRVSERQRQTLEALRSDGPIPGEIPPARDVWQDVDQPGYSASRNLWQVSEEEGQSNNQEVVASAGPNWVHPSHGADAVSVSEISRRTPFPISVPQVAFPLQSRIPKSLNKSVIDLTIDDDE